MWKDKNHEWNVHETLTVYEEVVGKFKYPSSSVTARNRFNEFSLRTIVNLLRNHKGKLVGEEQSDSEDNTARV